MPRAIKDFAFEISETSHKEFPPISPSPAWRRVQESRSPTKLFRRVGRVFQQVKGQQGRQKDDGVIWPQLSYRAGIVMPHGIGYWSCHPKV